MGIRRHHRHNRFIRTVTYDHFSSAIQTYNKNPPNFWGIFIRTGFPHTFQQDQPRIYNTYFQTMGVVQRRYVACNKINCIIYLNEKPMVRYSHRFFMNIYCGYTGGFSAWRFRILRLCKPFVFRPILHMIFCRIKVCVL